VWGLLDRGSDREVSGEIVRGEEIKLLSSAEEIGRVGGREGGREG
jgi:hypothetical protein